MKNKIGNEKRISLNEWMANEARWEKREGVLLTELTRLLLHIAPEVEPASDVVSVYWQVDNAVCGLLKERHLTPLAPDACPYCLGKGEEPLNKVMVRCRFCAGTGKRG